MTTDLLIQKLQAEILPHEGSDERHGWNTALQRAVAIIRQHETEQPQLSHALDTATKYAIADKITLDNRTKTDVVQDVWDEIVERLPMPESCIVSVNPLLRPIKR